MDANQPNNGITESVYDIHKSHVFSSTDKVKHPQGFYIDQIVDYAHTSIPEDEASSIRCATFKSLNNTCKFIAAKEDIPESKVYPALRMIGYNIRYHNMKCDKSDNLYNLGNMVKQCILTVSPSMIEFATGNTIFKDVSSVQYRMRKDVIAISMKDAEQYGIKVSELNLYNVLEGINTLVSNEPDYILLRDKRLFKSVLEYFGDIKSMIDYKYGGIHAALSKWG
jgi:hypothetical protein